MVPAPSQVDPSLEYLAGFRLSLPASTGHSHIGGFYFTSCCDGPGGEELTMCSKMVDMTVTYGPGRQER